MEIVWEDNGNVEENWILRTGHIISHEDGEENVLEDLDYKFPIDEQFVLRARDQAGNIAEEVVNLKIRIPEFEITDINYL